MKILALELSSARGSIAWSDGVAEAKVAEFANDRKHSGLFFEQLKRSTRELPQPDRVAVGLGPGSYAGTRIAIAAALGLCAATGAALVGIASVRLVSTDAPEYIVVGDARRQSLYLAHVRQRRCVKGPMLCSESELRDRLAVTDLPVFASESLPSFPSVQIIHPSAAVLAQLAPIEPLPNSDVPLEPIYLREPHITHARSVLVGRTP